VAVSARRGSPPPVVRLASAGDNGPDAVTRFGYLALAVFAAVLVVSSVAFMVSVNHTMAVMSAAMSVRGVDRDGRA